MEQRSLPQSAQNVQDYLRQRGYTYQVKELPDTTRSAEEAARTIGCSVSQIAKSLVFKDKKTQRPVLIIASGSNRVDLQKITHATGLELEKADGKYVKERIGFAIGGVPPVAHQEEVIIFLDEELKKYELLWAAAGTPFSVFQLLSSDLQPLTNGKYIDLKQA
ncbi:MAG: YbaK/EbsC family protein [Parachlamydiales bacterium]|jgi:prolyl-tRNA editing enzyme YbaK/EbsC (Cys-tRNA(Pro) deacylase)